jgi:hypothetical protein
MEISYLRSSSYNCWDICQQQYYLEYVLGLESKSGIAANRGTAFHKIMECLARAKLADQNNKKFITGKEIGKIGIYTKSRPYTSNDFVDIIIDKVFDYYSNQPDIDFKLSDKKLLTKWTYIIVDDKGFDPRNLDIFDVEQHFDIEIKKDWAKLQDGSYLRIKGTMDLLIKHDNCLELIDWKSGKKKNWVTMQEKTFKDFMDDFQLRLYHYVIRTLYPEYSDVLVTINYVRDGGPVTMAHNDNNLKKTEQKIQEKLKIIQNCTKPQLKSLNPTFFFCRQICHFGKNYIGNKTQCQYVYDLLNKDGMEKTTAKMREKDFSIDYYEAPG